MVRGVQDFYTEGYGSCDLNVWQCEPARFPVCFRDNEHYRKFILSDSVKGIGDQMLKKGEMRVVKRDKNWLRDQYQGVASKKSIRSLETLVCAVSVISVLRRILPSDGALLMFRCRAIK